MFNEVRKELGTFEVTGDKLIVTDPCYTRDTDCHGIVSNVLPGTWQALIFTTTNTNGWGERVTELQVRHSTAKVSHDNLAPFDVPVDSGQAGVFVEELYPHAETGDYGDETTFYGRACAATLRDISAGVLKEGAVSSSGYGDGCYECWILRDSDDHVMGVRIVFIKDDDFRDEDSYDNDDPFNHSEEEAGE